MIKVSEYSVSSDITEYSDDRLLSPQSTNVWNVHKNKVEQDALAAGLLTEEELQRWRQGLEDAEANDA